MQMTRLSAVTLVSIGLGSGFIRADQGPIPQTFANLQFYPRDIPRATLIQRMREFSFDLGVACAYCHDGPADALDYAADTKAPKRTARAMLAMMDALNTRTLPALPARRTPPVAIMCVTCHRGQAVPKTLATELTAVIGERGIPAAVERYRELRANPLRGWYAFDEWTMNELGRELAEAGLVEAAVAMLELNAEFYPKSPSIDMMLADLFVRQGRRDQAIARLEAAIGKVSDEARKAVLRRRIEAIKSGGGVPEDAGPNV